jgi:hypothetical protein
MSWEARKRERERDVIEQDSELCDELLVWLWEAHTVLSMFKREAGRESTRLSLCGQKTDIR